MSPESHPESGSTIAFETKYEVRTQVDSSAPADKFPEMCGNATFAIDVSSTSMNVASVTVTAITQGLIDPSGILSFAAILFSTTLSTLGSLTLYLSLRTTASLSFFIPRYSHQSLEDPCRLPPPSPSRFVQLLTLDFQLLLFRNHRRVHIHPRPQH